MPDNQTQTFDLVEFDNTINELANTLQPMVQEIETSPETTMNHYGDYLTLMVQLIGNDTERGKLLSLALIRAGAKRQGVDDALRMMG